MNSKIAAAILAFGSVVNAHVASLPRSNMDRCAVPEPTEEQLANSEALSTLENARLLDDTETFRAPISVNVYVHVVSASTSRYISVQQIQDQIEYMNESFSKYDVSFNLVDTDFTTNSNWGAGNNEVAMKSALRQGSYSDLNLYFVDLPKLNGKSALGYCHFPKPNVSEGSTTFIKDGCVIMAESVPGGNEAPFNLGGTAVHEIGHWFDLYHTFEGGCNGGDQAADTPAQSSASSGCPVGRDSCPNHSGLDPIHNFMDYSDDACYEEFTAGQQVRMHSSFETYRR